MNKVTKEQALARLGALESEAAALRRIIEAPEPVAKKPLVQSKDEDGYPVLFHAANQYYGSSGVCAGNAFATAKQAQAYAEAFNTLLDLRRQPGSEAAEDGKNQWFINYIGNADDYVRLSMKTERLCPWFDTKESALAARDVVGLERILRMYNTLHGRYE